MTMTKLEHASLELLKAMESDADNAQELYQKAKDDLAEAGILWAQGYWIKQVEEKRKVNKVLEECLEHGHSFPPFPDETYCEFGCGTRRTA